MDSYYIIIKKGKNMTSKTFNLGELKTLIAYDLSPCEISAEDIHKENSQLWTSFLLGKESFSLPNTTLLTKLNRQDAENAFREAVKKASSKEKITKLFVVDVSDKKAFIENN